MAARRTLGVTGQVGCGKSAVRGWLAARGAVTVDADEVVHRLLATDAGVAEDVVERFGPGVRSADGAIDRGALAAIVFGDRSALGDLEAVLHPRVRQAVVAWLADAPADAPVAVVEAVKLIESGLHELLDEVWLVLCERTARRGRMSVRGWTADEIERRMAASPSTSGQLGFVDRVIDNSGSERATAVQLERAWRHLMGCAQEESDRADMG